MHKQVCIHRIEVYVCHEKFDKAHSLAQVPLEPFSTTLNNHVPLGEQIYIICSFGDTITLECSMAKVDIAYNYVSTH